MRKRLMVACVVFALIGTTAGGVYWAVTLSPNHRISDESFARLRIGMTLEEVEQILGVPPGDYGPGGPGYVISLGIQMGGLPPLVFPPPDAKIWLAGELAIIVDFDERGRVQALYTDYANRPYDSFWEMIFQKLGLQKKKVVLKTVPRTFHY